MIYKAPSQAHMTDLLVALPFTTFTNDVAPVLSHGRLLHSTGCPSFSLTEAPSAARLPTADQPYR